MDSQGESPRFASFLDVDLDVYGRRIVFGHIIRISYNFNKYIPFDFDKERCLDHHSESDFTLCRYTKE